MKENGKCRDHWGDVTVEWKEKVDSERIKRRHFALKEEVTLHVREHYQLSGGEFGWDGTSVKL